MFNLIVSDEPKSQGEGSVWAKRVLKYTEQHLIERFMVGASKTLNIYAAMALPTLFMTEGFGNEIARVGRLTRLELRENELGEKNYHFHYSADSDVPSMTNAEIYELA